MQQLADLSGQAVPRIARSLQVLAGLGLVHLTRNGREIRVELRDLKALTILPPHASCNPAATLSGAPMESKPKKKASLRV
jgi:predicted transcriptional regulator